MANNLLTLQIARCVAANLVILSHLSVVETKYTAGGVLPSFSLYGIAGVDVFFVLSGFIMVAVAGRGIAPLQFLWRRAARIYPTYQFDLSDLLDRQVGRPLALEYAPCIDAGLTELIRTATSIAQKAARRGKLAIGEDRGQRVADRQ